METQKHARETKPSGLQTQHGSGAYLLMVNNIPVFSLGTTRAICAGVLALLAGATLVPAGMLPLVPSSGAIGVLICSCLFGVAAAYLAKKSNFPILAGGMRMTNTLLGVAGLGLMAASAFSPALSLSFARATVLATLLLSVVSGLICMNLWKEMLVRADAPVSNLHIITAHWWHFAFGGIIFAIILSPFTVPAMFHSQTVFLVARLFPVTLSIAMSLVLIERSRAFAGMHRVGERVAALGLAAQLALLVSMNPLSLAWGIALVLVLGQIFTIGQWLLALQLTKSTGAQAKVRDLSLQNNRLREEASSQRQQILQAVHANDTKTYETLNSQREQWQRKMRTLNISYEELRRDFVAFKAQVSSDVADHLPSSPDMIEARFSSLANLMHELNHPVSAIMNSSQLLMLRSSTGRDPALTRQAQTLFSYSRRLSHTIKFVLDFDKDMQPIFQSFDLVHLLRNLAKDEQTIQPLRAIRLVLAPPFGEVGEPLPEVCDVDWERDRIEAVLFNLLDNAEKYSRRNAPIMLRAWLTADEAAVVITVRDRGTGMSALAQQRIFERSYRSNQHARISGHGLGLWMVKTIVAQHHGAIAVTSVEGEGTTMRLTIPCVMPDNQDEASNLLRHSVKQ